MSIQVGIRCRPFTIDDQLGVDMKQNSAQDGEVNLLNSDYTTNRFAFSYSWWSAYGWKRRCKSDLEYAEGMHLVDQKEVYDTCGYRIRDDLLEGCAVVIFAYGLSGSGKTFSVFGMDDPKEPMSWFYQSGPEDKGGGMWGVFPNLAFEVFAQKTDGWKIKMKYFQNVVDIVRDLMSPTGEENSYKAGMKKDADGFMDIDWCSEKNLDSWDDLRKTFQIANARKAIAPTQFNHQSTRGHCIMTLELEKPNKEDPSRKDRGRLYVCDLAGTEPAGDIFYAMYTTVKNDDGTVDHNLIGPHKDQKKTKELQDQGKKINLSLSEMACFFMKMAQAVLAKKLKPGKTIPGCNSYFLCKYLKDTMVQAKTYLFCAIRPEKTYHKYTYATLGFAKNASVIKLQPKKAQTAMSPQERKLMAELDEMKALVKQLQESSANADPAAMEAMQAALSAKQANMANMMNEGDDGMAKQEEQMKREQEEYAARGIDLTYFSKSTDLPHFYNVEDDPFRSERFMYILRKPENIFGTGGDIRPPSLTIVRGHCSVKVDGDTTTLIGGKGDTYHNGKMIKADEEIVLTCYDRVVLGSEMMMYESSPVPEGAEKMSPEDAIDEFQAGLASGGGGSAANAAFEEQKRKFEEEKRKFMENGGSSGGSVSRDVDAEQQLMMEKEIADVMPKTKELKQICDLFDRSFLDFSTSFERGPVSGDGMGAPKVKVQVHNLATKEHIFLDPFEFTRGFSVLKDEMVKMRNAIANDREYALPEPHDPVSIMFDNTFYLGVTVIFPEYLIYMLDTDDDEVTQDIVSVGQGARGVGTMEISFTMLGGPNPEDRDTPCPDVLEKEELLGKPWTAEISIKGAVGLPLMADVAYCQYEFWDFGAQEPTLFTTDTVEYNPGTSKPDLNYTFVHHIDKVTQGFIDFLDKPMEVQLYVSPDIVPPKVAISTANAKVVENIKSGVGSARPAGAGGGADASKKVGELQAELTATKASMQSEINALKKQVNTLKMSKKMLIFGASEAARNTVRKAGVEVAEGTEGSDASKACAIQ